MERTVSAVDTGLALGLEDAAPSQGGFLAGAVDGGGIGLRAHVGELAGGENEWLLRDFMSVRLKMLKAICERGERVIPGCEA